MPIEWGGPEGPCARDISQHLYFAFRLEDHRGDGLWTEVWGQQKQSTDPDNNQHNPQYANYWAPLTHKRHIPPHSAQPRHTNDWAPRTRKRHQQEHWPQRLTERSDPTQHAKGRTGDCPEPRKETTTGGNVTQGRGGARGPGPCPSRVMSGHGKHRSGWGGVTVPGRGPSPTRWRCTQGRVAARDPQPGRLALAGLGGRACAKGGEAVPEVKAATWRDWGIARAEDRCLCPPPALHWRGGEGTAPSRAPSLYPATVPLTPSASLNGSCNRQ